MLIYVWADYTWCFAHELDEMLMHHSDDYMTIELPWDMDLDDIEEFIAETKPQG